MFLCLKRTNCSMGYRNGCFYHGVQKGSNMEAIHLLETETTCLLEKFWNGYICLLDLFCYRVFAIFILTLTFLNIHFHVLKFT